MSVRVHLNTTQLAQSSYGYVTCPIWICMDEFFFPGAEWSDFAVDLLASWCEMTCRLYRGEARSETYHFQDGSYCFEVAAELDGSWTVTPWHDHVAGWRPVTDAQSGLVVSCNEQLATVAGEILSASNELIRAVKSMGWESRGIDALVRFEAELRRDVRSRCN